jgi:hypothetical protein
LMIQLYDWRTMRSGAMIPKYGLGRRVSDSILQYYAKIRRWMALVCSVLRNCVACRVCIRDNVKIRCINMGRVQRHYMHLLHENK